MENYFLIISSEDKKFLEVILSNCELFTNHSNENKDLRELLKRKIIEKPYPTLQIIQASFKTIDSSFYIQIFEELISTDLKIDDNLWKLLNFLSNFKNFHDTEKKICRILYEKSLHKNHLIFLSLIGRSDFGLLYKFLNHIELNDKFPNKYLILNRHLSEKCEHFTETVIQLPYPENENLKNLILLTKIGNELQDPNKLCKNLKNIGQLLDEIQIEKLTNFQSMIYLEFQRISFLLESLRSTNLFDYIKSEDLMKYNGILPLLYEKNEMLDYQELKNITEKLHEYRIKMYETDLKENKELELISYYLSLKLIYEIVTNQTQHFENFKILCRNISLSKLINLFEDVVKLIFLRWEVFNSTSMKFLKLKQTSETDLDTTFSQEQNTQRTGFICRTNSLKIILKCLKEISLKRSHTIDYKNAGTELKDKFNQITEIINDGLWRLDFLENNSKEENFIEVDYNEILPLVKSHTEFVFERKSSDDDELNEKKFSSLRRRTKHRKRSSIISSSSYGKYYENDDINVVHVKKDIVEDRGTIVKMLGSPENLGILALRTRKFQNIRNLIQTYNLQNTSLEKELNYLEKSYQERMRLNQIYKKYSEQEINNTNSSSIVDRIKKVAAIGFEVSKIINIIEKFSQLNPIEQLESDKNLLIEKYSKNEHYQYLEQFDEIGLKVLGIFDLTLCTNFNFEICSNILNIIKRLYGTKNIKSYNKIGCINFFINLIECMRILKSNLKINIGLKDMILNYTYSLKPDVLTIQLEKEKLFRALFPVNSCSLNIDDIQNYSKMFEELKSKFNYFERFTIYIDNLYKLINLRKLKIENNVNELLKYNPRNVIGELIFKENFTPSEIEQYVIPLNINLLHVIALNLCPEIKNESNNTISKYCDNEERKEKKLHEIYKYISAQNYLLSYLLQKINGTNVINNLACSINEKYLNNYIKLDEIKYISKLYNINLYTSALLYDEINFSEFNDGSADGDELTKILILNEQLEMNNNSKIKVLQTDLILDIIRKENCTIDIESRLQLINNLNDLNLKSKIILENYQKIKNSDLLQLLIQNILTSFNINELDLELKLNLEKIQNVIEIHTKISNELHYDDWLDSHKLTMNTPIIILKDLLHIENFELLYEWSSTISHNLITKDFLDFILLTLIHTNADFKYLIKFIESKYPQNDIIQFYDKNKEKFRNFDLLKYVVEYLTKNVINNDYQNHKISIIILETIPYDELESNWCLIGKPLLLIEQFIMNSKFEILSKILSNIKSSLNNNNSCKFCYAKVGNIYNIYGGAGPSTSKKFYLGKEGSSEFLLQNLNLYQKDHIITIECIDLLLRTYATKALDYQINDINTSSERNSSQSTDMSLDSLYEAFVMPKVPPNKLEWIPDQDAKHCMCCKIAVFTMLMRRHHCRRCGRVVCFACSKKRMKIPELYEEVTVRVCIDCFNHSSRESTRKNLKVRFDRDDKRSMDEEYKWQLSGNLTHDKVVREEFCYEHAPSVAMCLSILSFHTNNSQCYNLLLYHCRKLEKLFVPNPEVDFALVAKMLNCLAVAAKVRGGPATECDAIRDHSDIIMSFLQEGCEALLPNEPLNNPTLRKLGDLLVLNEKWSLALDIFFKCGYPTTGVFAAHGLACLRAGCFETAREKLSHCMVKFCCKEEAAMIFKIITNELEVDLKRDHNIPIIRRSNRSPPLLSDIIHIIETTTKIPQKETLTRATQIRNSNTSLASNRSKRSSKQNIPINEPALNILNSLVNVRQISKGNYNTCAIGFSENMEGKKHLRDRIFEECLHYVLIYGSHSDIITFLLRHKELQCTLRYFILQQLDSETFIQFIYMKFLEIGEINNLINNLIELDSDMKIWKNHILAVCRYLEKNNFLNSLYQLQLLLKDPIRAAMTCVRFYSTNCKTFCELQDRSIHLENAYQHLQSELELSQWGNMKHPVGTRTSRRDSIKGSIFLMHMDPKTLNTHINTILKQLEVSKFLSNAERSSREDQMTTDKILKQIRLDSTKSLPTLFDTMQEKIQICLLILLCSKNVEESFGLAYRIMHDYKLPVMKIYGITAKYLAKNNRLPEINKLIDCISSNNVNDNRIQYNIDEILSMAIHSAFNLSETETKQNLNNLIKRITSIDMQINCYIYIGQLKSAYLLAIQQQPNKLSDIRKILRQAELTNQIHIKKLCEKKLNILSKN